MDDFLLEYNNNPEFREFIKEINDPTSSIWEEYLINASYDFLSSNEIDIKNKKIDVTDVLECIDKMIDYFRNKEEYEKCTKLNTIKLYLND